MEMVLHRGARRAAGTARARDAGAAGPLNRRRRGVLDHAATREKMVLQLLAISAQCGLAVPPTISGT